MAVTNIKPIKSSSHFKNSIEYILQDNKTNDKILVDSYNCPPVAALAAASFKAVRRKEVMNKGNNVAWHLRQSFSPDDNVTPEQALEIGKRLMQEMYPTHQYVIATHVDKEHIHNHIIINAVNFKDYHKLNSNPNTYKKIREISDNLCKEYGLSVIDNNSKNNKQRLTKNLEEAITSADTYEKFLEIMKSKGYEIKQGKHLSFKDKHMQRFMRASTISLNYSINAIKLRIENSKGKVFNNKRNLYENKLSYSTIRKKLKAEIDSSIRKADSFEDFIADLEKKGIEVKLGKHISFKPSGQERFIRGKSIDKNLSYHYTEEAIKFRIKHKDEYKDIVKNKIGKVINQDKLNSNLSQWAIGKNGNSKRESRTWILKNILHKDYDFLNTAEGNAFSDERLIFGIFLEKYELKKAEMDKHNSTLEEINDTIENIGKMRNAVIKYRELKKTVDMYSQRPKDSMTTNDIKAYRTKASQLKYNENLIMRLKKQGYPVGIKNLDKWESQLQEQKRKISDSTIQLNLEFEKFEGVKFNFNNQNGWGISDEEAKKTLALYKEKQAAAEIYNEINITPVYIDNITH